jgi:hypothetical protein
MRKRFAWQKGDVKTIGICSRCKHKLYEWGCKAYLDGIPRDILDGTVDHRENVPGDNGIKFEEVKAE